jgi:drug/metabolite transporter (DMT)-like permease
MSGIVLGLAFALVASLALNGSYVIQHVGSGSAPPIDPRHPVATLLGLLRSPAWACGAALGMSGWALHVAALANAPLSLVQAFVTGGLAVMAPVASRVLRHPLTRVEWGGVGIVVVSLALLCVGLGNPDAHTPVRVEQMIGFLAACGIGASLLTRAATRWRPHALGLAGGLLYGAADVAIKALTGVAHAHGAGAVVLSPWLPVAITGTIAAFFAFQRGLQLGSAVPVISLMTAATTAVSVAGAFLVFGDSLGRTPLLVALHLVAFALVAVAAAALAPAAAAEPAAL